MNTMRAAAVIIVGLLASWPSHVAQAGETAALVKAVEEAGYQAGPEQN